MKLAEFDYHLPPERIAQYPLPERDASRLLLLDRRTGVVEDRFFRELPDLLRGNELLVVNNTRVFPGVRIKQRSVRWISLDRPFAFGYIITRIVLPHRIGGIN